MTVRLKMIWTLACAVGVGLAVACSSGSSGSSSTPTAKPAAVATTAPTAASAAAAPTATTAAAPTATSSSAASAASSVKIGDSSLGKVLTNPAGLTLYTYNKDVADSGQSTVSGGLLAAWPALTISSDTPVAPAGLTGSLATITRSDGSKQVTYKGLPLYLWQNDKAPGDVTGQGVAGFTVATP